MNRARGSLWRGPRREAVLVESQLLFARMSPHARLFFERIRWFS